MTTPAAAPPKRSPFAVGLAALLHSGLFIDAAEYIEKQLLNAGVKFAESKMPPPVAAAVDPVAQVGEQAVEEITDDEFHGQPIDASGLEQRVAGAVSTALAEGLAPLNSILTKMLQKLG